MGRGFWRFTVWVFGGQAVCSALLAFNRLVGTAGRDVVLFWLFTAMFVISAIYFLYLLRVRRNDAPFWDEDEARRDDWERRGRRL